MWEYLTALLLVSGGAFACIAGLGLVRMPDIYIRMHAATKAGTLGAGLIFVAVAVHFADAGVTAKALATIVFLVIFLWFGFPSLSIYKLITSSATSISLIWPASGMVVGGLFMVIHLLAQIFNGTPAAEGEESTHVM